MVRTQRERKGLCGQRAEYRDRDFRRSRRVGCPVSTSPRADVGGADFVPVSVRWKEGADVGLSERGARPSRSEPAGLPGRRPGGRIAQLRGCRHLSSSLLPCLPTTSHASPFLAVSGNTPLAVNAHPLCSGSRCGELGPYAVFGSSRIFHILPDALHPLACSQFSPLPVWPLLPSPLAIGVPGRKTNYSIRRFE